MKTSVLVPGERGEARVEAGDIEILLHGRQRLRVGEKEAFLSRPDLRVLTLLAANPDRPFTHEEVCDRAWAFRSRRTGAGQVTHAVSRIKLALLAANSACRVTTQDDDRVCFELPG